MHRFKRKALLKKKFWRGGRVVDCGGLENRCAARHPGFESLSLRWKELQNKENPCKLIFYGDFLFLVHGKNKHIKAFFRCTIRCTCLLSMSVGLLNFLPLINCYLYLHVKEFLSSDFFSINLPLFNSYLFILCYFKMWPSYYILKYKKTGGKLQLYKYQFMI